MAWLFGIAVECGNSEQAAEALQTHFAPFCGGRRFHDSTANWWFHGIPEGVSRSGAGSLDDAQQMTCMGQMLYERLRGAPPEYRFALVGVETDEFRTFDELQEEQSLRPFSGLVVSSRSWAIWLIATLLCRFRKDIGGSLSRASRSARNLEFAECNRQADGGSTSTST